MMRLYFLFFWLIALFPVANAAMATPQHGIAMIGNPKLPADFTHLPYANPHAPKGGKLTFGVVGTFDGLNPFVIKNFRTTARGLFADQQFGSLVYETLMARSYDEPFSLYGLLAENIEVNEERTQATFFLRSEARFADNLPVTVDDVIFSHALLRDYARPPYSTYMKQVHKIEKIGERGVRFHLEAAASRELVLLIAASMPILSRHNVDVTNFLNNDLQPILGSGPYIIDKVEAGRRIVYRRNPEYWGHNLPVNIGLYNFDKIEIVYYRNDNTRFEAFKKGLLDVFIEEDPNRWQRGYDFIGMREGRVKKEQITTGLPAPMIGFVFNTRRPIFQDQRVRQALSLMLDFQWINRNLYYDAYHRTQGFWDGSELSSHKQEQAKLEQFAGDLSETKTALEPSLNSVSNKHLGFDRKHAEMAQKLLRQAGFQRQETIFYQPNGRPFEFEVLFTRSQDEKLILAYARSLARIGIKIHPRQVDDSQYQNRLAGFDYDMIIGRLSSSLSPGTEQFNRWSSRAADTKGSFNFAGVKDKAIDDALETILTTRSYTGFVAAVNNLDRLLISGHYYIPLYHLPSQLAAYWSHIARPKNHMLYGYRLPTWWHEDTHP